MTRLRDVVAVRGGGIPRRSTPEFYGGSIPWVTPKDMKQAIVADSSVRLTQSGVDSSPAKLIAPGSVLVVVRSGVLKHTLPVALTTAPVTLNQDMKALTPSAEVDPAFLARLIKSLESRVLTWVRATTADNFPIENLLNLDVDIPPLDEQRRIAAILDQVDALRAKRLQALAHLYDLTQSVFHDMFGDPLRNPRGWETATVGDVCTRVTDGEHKTPRRSDTGVPLLSARSIQRGWIDFTATDFIADSEYDVLRKRIEPQEDDVLISCSGTIGRVARVREVARFAMVRSAALVRPGDAIAAGFLEQLLSTVSMNRLMRARANSSAQANLFQNQIRSLPVVVPPLEVQHDFEWRAQRVRARHAGLVKGGLMLDELFASVQARAFRGEL